MHRYSAHKGRSAKSFRRSAAKTHRKNVAGAVRGGGRL